MRRNPYTMMFYFVAGATEATCVFNPSNFVRNPEGKTEDVWMIETLVSGSHGGAGSHYTIFCPDLIQSNSSVSTGGNNIYITHLERDESVENTLYVRPINVGENIRMKLSGALTKDINLFVRVYPTDI